jgi:hypothetical protein
MRFHKGLALLLWSSAATAQHGFELSARYWFPDMAGTVRVARGGIGTDLDARTDLGIDNTNFPQGNVTWYHGRSSLGFAYTPIEYSGDDVLSRTVVFNGRTYSASTRVLSDIRARHLQLGWSYQFVNLAAGRFRLGPPVEANGFLLHGRLDAPNFSITESEDLSVGLPTFGAALDIHPHRMLGVYGKVSGFKAGSYGYFVSSDSGIKLRWRLLLLTAGYRTFNLHVEASNDFAHLRLRGPFVGAGFAF